MRYALFAGVTFVLGYIAGSLFGYRAAVVDYVENDAGTLRSMADTMYEGVEDESLPDTVQEALEKEDETDETTADDAGSKGFR